MPWSDNHQDVTRAVGAQRSSHNPYGQTSDSGLGDMPPEIFHRVMSAWRTGEKISDIHADWRAGVESRRPFNDQIRREAGIGGFEGHAEAMLGQTGDNPKPGPVRDAETGRYVDLAAEMRASGSQPLPGGLVPSETPTPPPDMNADIRAAYENAVAQRGTR